MSGEVRAKLAQTDHKMKKDYEKRRILEEKGVPHYFEAGDSVLLDSEGLAKWCHGLWGHMPL